VLAVGAVSCEPLSAGYRGCLDRNREFSSIRAENRDDDSESIARPALFERQINGIGHPPCSSAKQAAGGR